MNGYRKRDQPVLTDIYQSYEVSTQHYQKEFRDTNLRAIKSFQAFTRNQLPKRIHNKNQLAEFLGPVIFNCFDLEELIKLFSCLLLERQILFVSGRPDLISKVMFTLRDLILSKTDFQWHCFFITCLPTILIDNLNAPFPTLIGVLRPVFD